MKVIFSTILTLCGLFVFNQKCDSQTKSGRTDPLVFHKGTVHTLSGRLRPSGEKQFAFSGEKGVVLHIDNTRQGGFDVRIYGPTGEFDTEFDSTRVFDVELPYAGDDYLLIVRRKVGGSRASRSFRIRVSIE